MKTKTTFFIALLLISLTVSATVNRVRLSYRDDPATTVVIGWNQVNGSSPVVYYGTTDFGNLWNMYPSNKSVDRVVSHRGMSNNFARITGLQPNTVYYFVIKDDNSVSIRMSFKTLPDNANTPLMFISGGDTRTGVITEYDYTNCRTRRQDGNRLVSKIRPDFVSFSGDFVLLKTSNSQWNDFFDDWQLTMTAPDNRMYPCIVTFGNHEEADDAYKLFDVPIAEAYFAMSFNGNLLRIYSLNSDLDPCGYAPQLNWLTNDLQMHTNTSAAPYWKAAQYHLPMVPHGEYSPVTAQIDCWANLFKQYGVKVGMEGHTHVIKQTWPVSPSTASGSQKGFIKDTINGTVYIGEGCWGAPLRDLYSPNNWTRDQARFNGFQLIYVEKSKIEIRTAKFENVNSVAQVPMAAPVGTLPSNIVLWTPANGQVVVINNNMPGNDASLSALSSSIGSLYPVFAASTINYTVTLPFGTSNIPVLSATPNDPSATVQITQPTSVNGTGTVLVTAADGITTRTYTVTFTVSTGNDATLVSLSTNTGNLMPAFAPNTFNYTVLLPYGTTTVPLVTAIPADPYANANVTQAASVTDAAVVLVTAANGVNTNTYTVQFALGSSSDKDIVSFNIANQSSPTVIDQANATIELTMPYGSNMTALVPLITINGASVSPPSGLAQNFLSPVYYTVTAMDSSQKTYLVTVSMEPGTGDDATLIHLETNLGLLQPAFDPAVTNYTVQFNDTLNGQQITAITTDPQATKKVFLPTNLYGNMAERTASILVISKNNTVTKTYNIKYELATAVQPLTHEKTILIYPNPSTGVFTVELPSKSGVSELTVYNAMAKHITSLKPKGSTATYNFDLSGQEKGVYYLYVRSRKDVLVFKLFLQ